MSKAGKDFLLKVAVAGVQTTLGGLQAKSMTINNEEIDITNHGSNQWKEVLDGAGVRSLAVSGSGVHDDSAPLKTVEDAAFDGTLLTFQLIDVATGGKSYTFSAKVTSFEHSGEHNAAHTYSISIVSSGEVTRA